MVEQYKVYWVELDPTRGGEMAMKRSKKLTSVDKANVLDSSRLWRKTVIEMSKDVYKRQLFDSFYYRVVGRWEQLYHKSAGAYYFAAVIDVYKRQIPP